MKPVFKLYLELILEGFSCYAETGKQVKVDQFGPHPIFSSANRVQLSLSAAHSNRPKEMNKKFITKIFILIILMTSLWVHASQLFRFFAYVKPELQGYLSAVPNVAPMDDLGTLLIWGGWDT